MSVYIQSAKQISAQKPLSDEWFDNPLYYDTERVQSLDPVFADYLTPLMSRRMCPLLKRAVVLSRLALKDADVETPDAIISGSGLGCIDNTERFLKAMLENGEKYLQPTYFMQSTHNAISSTVAIDLKCHGYNNTYVHRGVSFDHAMFDAMMQFAQGRIHTALLGGYDELTDDYYMFFKKTGMFDFQNTDYPLNKRCFASEVAVSMLLGDTKTDSSLCKISAIELMYRPSQMQLAKGLRKVLEQGGCGIEDISAVMTGACTDPVCNEVYSKLTVSLLPQTPEMRYKHIFGESFSSVASGAYAAATCLQKGKIPSFLLNEGEPEITDVKRILLYNHCKNKSHSFILLSSC